MTDKPNEKPTTMESIVQNVANAASTALSEFVADVGKTGRYLSHPEELPKGFVPPGMHPPDPQTFHMVAGMETLIGPLFPPDKKEKDCSH